jgi:predicted alpha/beta superfamily hydrolase
MKKLLILSVTALLSTLAFSQSDEVRIPGSQIRTFTSSIVNGQEYILQVSLPAGYATSSKKYPVVYLMDSQWDFPLVTALYGQQYFDGFVPELIIVGITWGGNHPNPDSLRARDYTPTNEKRLPQSGGAEQFLSVIKNEVFPLIEKTYRVDPNDKTLMGCSLGGLFTMYTLFTHPQMFNRYVAASPAFMWDNSVLYQYEKRYYANTSNPPANLFMCVGGVETSVPEFEKLTKFLHDRHYPNLQIESKVLENTGHSGTKGIGYEKGLQFAFKRPSLKLSSDKLKTFNGDYKMDDGTIIKITSQNGTLSIAAGTQKSELKAASENDFYLTSGFLNIHFIKDENGNIKGFQLDRYGANTFAKKVK